jgi:hypothetical protein
VKTTIKNLSGNWGKWETAANEAADAAIRAKTFPKAGGAFEGQSTSGIDITGYYRGDKIDTFSPKF